LTNWHYETDENVLAMLDDVRTWAVNEKREIPAYEIMQEQAQQPQPETPPQPQTSPEPATLTSPPPQPEPATQEAANTTQDAGAGSTLVNTVLKAAKSSEGQKIIKGLFNKMVK
jgi:biotin carboxyl carrier protein